MKKVRYVILLITVALSFIFTACATSGNSNIIEVENKGTMFGTPTPDWVKTYLEKSLNALQAQYDDRYCFVGVEKGNNRQVVLTWADQFGAQQRIGSMIRTNIAGRYETAISVTSGGQYQQEIDIILNAVVNVSYSGAQREADWWVRRRVFDPDNREIYTDEYTAYVLYTVPKETLNRQIALALETNVTKNASVYDVTIALSRDILLQGYNENELAGAAAIERTAAISYDPPGSAAALALDEINRLDEYNIGRDVAAAVLANYNIWNGSPSLIEYVNLICAALAANSPNLSLYNGYHIAVIDSAEINAFATPGGHILITRGLISAAQSEDALAGVIAHEMAHILLRHGLRSIKTNRGVEDWLAQFVSSGAETVAVSISNGFSQVQEFDADITALALLAATGYNPQGLLEMLQELQKIQPGVSGGFNSTHPSPSSRLVNAQIAAARYSQTGDTRAAAIRQSRFNAVKLK